MEERMIDDEYGRGIRLKKTQDGYVDVTDELAEDGEAFEDGESAEEIAFEFPMLDEDDEDLVGLSPEEAIALRKKKEEEADIRPMIYKWEMRDDALFVQLATGSAGNCKPDAVMDAYDAFRGVESEPFAYHFHRLEMYARQGEELVPMDALGEPVMEAVPRVEEK